MGMRTTWKIRPPSRAIDVAADLLDQGFIADVLHSNHHLSTEAPEAAVRAAAKAAKVEITDLAPVVRKQHVAVLENLRTNLVPHVEAATSARDDHAIAAETAAKGVERDEANRERWKATHAHHTSHVTRLNHIVEGLSAQLAHLEEQLEAYK